MEEFSELLTCSIQDIIPIMESIMDNEADRHITYDLKIHSTPFFEDIFLTISVETNDTTNKNKQYEVTRTKYFIGIKELT